MTTLVLPAFQLPENSTTWQLSKTLSQQILLELLRVAQAVYCTSSVRLLGTVVNPKSLTAYLCTYVSKFQNGTRCGRTNLLFREKRGASRLIAAVSNNFCLDEGFRRGILGEVVQQLARKFYDYTKLYWSLVASSCSDRFLHCACWTPEFGGRCGF